MNKEDDMSEEKVVMTDPRFVLGKWRLDVQFNSPTDMMKFWEAIGLKQ